MPKHQAYQPHAGIASEATAVASLVQQCSSPSDPRQGDIDPSAKGNKKVCVQYLHKQHIVYTKM